MASDGNGLADEAQVTLNDVPAGLPASVPDRPADSAPKAKWVDYVVALGADRDAASERTRSDLADLADRLGG